MCDVALPTLDGRPADGDRNDWLALQWIEPFRKGLIIMPACWKFMGSSMSLPNLHRKFRNESSVTLFAYARPLGKGQRPKKGGFLPNTWVEQYCHEVTFDPKPKPGRALVVKAANLTEVATVG